MSNFFLDNFTAANGTLLSAHTPDTGTWTSPDSTLVIESNALTCTTTSAIGAYATQTPVADNVEGTLVVNYVSGYSLIGMRFRWDTSGNNYYKILAGTNLTSGQLWIYRVISGSQTQLSTVILPILAGAHTFQVTVTDATDSSGDVVIDFKLDGTLALTATDGFGSNPSGNKYGIDFEQPNGIVTDSIDSVAFVEISTLLSITSTSFVSASDTEISLACVSSGGTSPVTYQWYRSTTPGFTPGSGNIMSGATSATLNDSTAVANTVYSYVCIVSDASPTSVTSDYVYGRLGRAAISLGFIGDSITNGGGPATPTKPGTLVGQYLQATFGERVVTITNQGVNGTQTSDWISGSTNLIAAKTAFAAAGVTHVCIMLGTNDALNLVSSTDYNTHLTSLVNDLVGAGYKVILNYPTGSNPAQSGYDKFSAQLTYSPVIDALCNHSTILQGDQEGAAHLLENLTLWTFDGTHLTQQGDNDIASLWLGGIVRAFGGLSGENASVITGFFF